MTFLEIALRCAARGWQVHPLKPGDKQPLTTNGKLDATTDTDQIKAWGLKWPNANVGISCGPSDLCVLDIDHGITSYEHFLEWAERDGIPTTYAVRTGRRPDFGVQVYFRGAIPDVRLFELDGCSGQIKSLGGYVLASGCLHPSGALYEDLVNAPIADTPDVVRSLRTNRIPDAAPGAPFVKIAEGAGRHQDMFSQAGKLRNMGMDADQILLALQPLNETRYEVPLPFDYLGQCARNAAAKYEVPAVEPKVIIGKAQIAAKRTLFDSYEDAATAPPVSFLIDGFLQREGVTGLAAPVRERKSLLALNIAHALLTGEKLFDWFSVTLKPERVIYLCPEVSRGPFYSRFKKIGLLPYVGKTLFCRTLSTEGHIELDDAELKTHLPGSVVILDTAIRFLKGNENESEHVREFANTLFGMMRDGAEAILMLHHSAKAKSRESLSLESALRGSGELGAFMACCYGTCLVNPDDGYDSPSFVSNLKQRDFESHNFRLSCSREDLRMRMIDEPGPKVTLKMGDKDGRADEAKTYIRSHIGHTAALIVAGLKEIGIERSPSWVASTKKEIKEALFKEMQENGGKLPKLPSAK